MNLKWAGQPHTYYLVAHMTCLLSWLHSLPTAFLCRHSIFLASLTAWCSWGFILTTLSGAAYRDTVPVIYCPASQVFLWNLSGSLHDQVKLTFCISAKPMSYGWHRRLTPALAVAGIPWPAVASECLGNWTWQNTSCSGSVYTICPSGSLLSRESLSNESVIL
jgi:hypothetical protein